MGPWNGPNYVPKAGGALMFVVAVAVAYFIFLVCIGAIVIMITIVVQYMYFRSEYIPFTEMPIWVSKV